MTERERAAYLDGASAPKAIHDLLDKFYPLLAHGKRMGMSGQLIISLDRHGNLAQPKVNLSGIAKNEASV